MPVTIQDSPGSFASIKQTKPVAIPSTIENVATSDAYLHVVTLSSNSASTATVTIADRQGTPLPAMKDIPIDPGGVYVQQFHGRWMPGGITWICSAADAVIGFMRFSQ